MAHVGLVHRDLCECKVKGFRVVSSIERDVSKKKNLQGMHQKRSTCKGCDTFVERSMFLGQGDDSNKVFIFKMSEVGPGSGVHLVTWMQASSNLEYAWIMSDHIKRVNGWTTLVCHVYDSTYQRVMTIACCDF